jgi:rRNA-processing protein FCF1
MILIDTNALVVLLIGIIDPRLIKTHKRTSIYEEEDYNELISVIGKIDNLIVLPNVWTEVDNLLNNFSGNYKFKYVEEISTIIKLTTEKYISTSIATESDYFFELGVTDSILLEYAKKCKLLITSDSKLSDYAIANGIKVYDLISSRNQRFFN